MSLLDDMMAIKRELDALPPPLLAVKCNPSDEPLLRRATHPPLNKTIFSDFGSIAVYWDVQMPRGCFVPAYDRATVDAWRLQEWREYLVNKLRWRVQSLSQTS